MAVRNMTFREGKGTSQGSTHPQNFQANQERNRKETQTGGHSTGYLLKCLLKIIKVMKNKERPEETAKCSVISWIESWSRKRTLMVKLLQFNTG